MKKSLTMFVEIEKERSKLYALVETNISGRSEVEIKKCADHHIYREAKDILPLLIV